MIRTSLYQHPVIAVMNLATFRVGQLRTTLNSTARSLKKLSSELVASVENLYNLQPHARLASIERTDKLTVLGVVINDRMTAVIMLATCCRHVPVYCTCCERCGIMALQKRR